jgi:hypothetical protein
MSLGLMGLATVFLAQRAHGLWCIYVCCALVGASAAFHGSASQVSLSRALHLSLARTRALSLPLFACPLSVYLFISLSLNGCNLD